MRKKLTSDDFIRIAREVHSDKYDYSKVEYVNSRTKVCIICPIHGEFWQDPRSHLNGFGCGRCGGTGKLSKNELINRFHKIHGDKYDYSKVEYKNMHTKICIICPIHGEFYQTPHNHINGAGCPHCSGKLKLNTEDFIRKAREIHGDKYIYNKTIYQRSLDKVIITCPEHGDFEQRPNDHLSGRGCPYCAHISNWDTRGRITTDEFIRRVKEIHGDKYDLSEVEYINKRSKVNLICHKKYRDGTEHGLFTKTAGSLLAGEGCPRCRNSKLQLKVEAFLRKNEIIFESEYSWEWLVYKYPMRVDIFIPKYNTVIECQGIQHYIPLRYGKQKQEDADVLFEERQNRDNLKKELCAKHGLKVVYFTEKTIYEKWVNKNENLFYDLNKMLDFIKNE